MSGEAGGPLPTREERLQRARAVVAEALDAHESADPYRLALAAILALVPLPIAACWCNARPLAVERVVRTLATRVSQTPSARPSQRDVVTVRHAAQHTARWATPRR